MKTMKSQVTLKRIDGNELDIVDAARVSFDKESAWEVAGWKEIADYDPEGRVVTHVPINRLSEKDAGLIRYLARNGHWTPLAHVGAQFRIKTSVFVARQLVKHQIGLVWNEVSRRYVSTQPEYLQMKWRWAADNVKQGSGEPMNEDDSARIDAIFWPAVDHCDRVYAEMLGLGVAPEQARAVLNLNHMTEWIWTGSLVAWARICKQRLDSHAQGETSEIATPIDRELRVVFPNAWPALMGEN